MSSVSTNKKLILIIGGTGVQGFPIIDALLAPSPDGSPSPYAIRALTRDPNHRRTKALAARGIELVKGAIDDEAAVLAALDGAWGAFVNTDSFTIGEQKEVFRGIRIFELAKQVKTVRHYVWSSLDYASKKSGFNPKYRAGHYDGKGRVTDWMKAQPSVVNDDEMSWSVLTTAPYIDMIRMLYLGPMTRRDDGTYVFAFPTDKGRLPLMSLKDIGFFARYTFDNRAAVSGQDLEVASDIVTLDEVVETFKKVTGKKAVAAHLTIDEWFGLWKNPDHPAASEAKIGDGSTTWRKSLGGFWNIYRDNILTRDLEWIRKINPNADTIEGWMRDGDFSGEVDQNLWKYVEDGHGLIPDWDAIAAKLGKA